MTKFWRVIKVWWVIFLIAKKEDFFFLSYSSYKHLKKNLLICKFWDMCSVVVDITIIFFLYLIRGNVHKLKWKHICQINSSVHNKKKKKKTCDLAKARVSNLRNPCILLTKLDSSHKSCSFHKSTSAMSNNWETDQEHCHEHHPLQQCFYFVWSTTLY